MLAQRVLTHASPLRRAPPIETERPPLGGEPEHKSALSAAPSRDCNSRAAAPTKDRHVPQWAPASRVTLSTEFSHLQATDPPAIQGHKSMGCSHGSPHFVREVYLNRRAPNTIRLALGPVEMAFCKDTLHTLSGYRVLYLNTLALVVGTCFFQIICNYGPLRMTQKRHV